MAGERCGFLRTEKPGFEPGRVDPKDAKHDIVLYHYEDMASKKALYQKLGNWTAP